MGTWSQLCGDMDPAATLARVSLPMADAWPTPVRELVRRADEASVASERHQCVYLALEASIRLGVAASRFDIKDPRSFDAPSIGTWASALATAHKRAATAGLNLFDKGLLVDPDVRAAAAHFNPGLQAGDSLALSALLEAIAAHRNRTIAHGGHLPPDGYDEGTRHLTVVLERAWTAGLFLRSGSHLTARAVEGSDQLCELLLEQHGDGPRSLTPWVVGTSQGECLFFNGCSSFMTVDDSAADHDFTRRRRGLGIGSGGAAPA